MCILFISMYEIIGYLIYEMFFVNYLWNVSLELRTNISKDILVYGNLFSETYVHFLYELCEDQTYAYI